ncbi:hypothetical protein WJX82_005430 [Trebouxia sp. C0006]
MTKAFAVVNVDSPEINKDVRLEQQSTQAEATSAQAAHHDPLTQARPGHPFGVTLNLAAAGLVATKAWASQAVRKMQAWAPLIQVPALWKHGPWALPWVLPAHQIIKVVYSKVARSTVVGLLREHLQRNIVRIGKQWHYQSKGIPQGVTLGPRSAGLLTIRILM